MPSISWVGSRLRSTVQGDQMRTAFQTVTAVTLSYVVMRILPLDTVSWAVFSALFVVQANIGGTVGVAIWRVAGAFVGATVAVALILLIGGSHHTVIVLIAGVTIMSALSIRWPALSYGLVTVSVIAVTPDIGLIDDAIQKVAAIMVGSCSALLVCLLVFPVSAHRKATTYLANALRLSGRNTIACMDYVVEGRTHDHDIQQQKAKVLAGFQQATSVWQQAHLEKSRSLRRQKRRWLVSEALFAEAGQLLESLTLVNQSCKVSPCVEVDDVYASTVKDLSHSIDDQLNALADAISSNRNEVDIAITWSYYRLLCKATDRLHMDKYSQKEREYFMVLKWTLHSVVTSVDALACRIQKTY